MIIKGSTIVSASGRLGRFESIPASEQMVISKERALEVWNAFKIKNPHVKNSASARSFRLSFEFTNKTIYNKIKYKLILAPTWIVDDDRLIMIDGHSGQVWFND